MSDFWDAVHDRDQWNYNDASITHINAARANFIAKEEELKIYRAAYEEYKLIREKALRALNYLLGKAYGQ